MASITGAVTRRSHIFLSHAGADTQAAGQFAEILRRAGVDVWFDKDSLPPGDQWMAALEAAIQSASAMIVYIGRMGIETWVDREVRQGLVRNTQSGQSFRFIPVLGDGADPAKLPPFVQQHQFTDLRDPARAPEQIRQLIEVLQNRSAQALVRSDYWNTHSPFRSLQIFGPEDSWLFFGRDGDTDQLLSRMSEAPVLTVIGNSGSGKSSLIRAGLIPALRRGRFRYQGKWADSWRTVVFRPSASPFDYLAETLPGQLAPELSPAERAEFVTYCKRNLATSADALRNAIVALPKPAGVTPEAARVLLVADQFEELFTLCDDKDLRKAYVDSLLTAAQLDGSVPVHLVITLRADFYANCLDYPQLGEHLSKNLYNVPLISSPQLREAIENRLSLAGGRAEPGLIDSLLADVGGEPGNLALLEHALSRLWEKCGGSGAMLTGNAYAEIGRLKGALGRYADEVYDAVRDENDKRLVQRIFLELVQLGDNAQDTRRRVPKKILLELGEPEKVERLIADLASKCLLTTSGEGPRSPSETFVEVSHEALVREWPTLREWLENNREDLRLERLLLKAAEEWNALNRDPGALLRGLRLGQATEWLAKHQDAHSAIRDLIQASAAAQEEENRKEREAQDKESSRQRELLIRSRRFNYAIGALLLFSVGFSFFIYRDKQELDADRLASLSRGFSDPDSMKALLISLYALQTSEKRGTIEAVQDAVQRVVKLFTGPGGGIMAIAAPLNGERLGVAWQDGTIALLEPGSSKEASDPAHVFRDNGSRLAASGPVLALAASATGKWLAAAGNRADIDLWDLTKDATKPEKLPSLQFPSGGIMSVSFDPKEKQLLAAQWGGDATIQTLGSSNPAARTISNSSRAYQAVFSPDGQSVGISLARGAVTIMSPATGAQKPIDNQATAVKSLDFGPDGKLLAFGDTAKVTLMALSSLKRLKTLPEESGVDRVVFSPKGDLIVSMNSGGSATVWDVSSGEIRMRLSGVDPFRSAAFTRVGNAPHIAFGTAGGKLLIYDLDVNHLRKRAHEIWLEHHSPVLSPEDCLKYLLKKTCPALTW